jgi:hypothetical protein
MAVKRYNGTSWDTVAGLGAQGAAATSSSITTWVKTAAGGETSLSGNSDSSTTLAYTPGQEQFFINGVLQVRGSDYTATNGTSITGISALIAGDIATVTTVNAFSVTGAVPLSTVTANGDLIVGTSSGAVGRLGVGSTGQVLSVSGGSPAWATPATPTTAKNFTLLNTGGTALNGLSTVTVSGLSGYDQLYVHVQYASLTGAGNCSFRFNGDTTSKYYSNSQNITYLSSTSSGMSVNDWGNAFNLVYWNYSGNGTSNLSMGMNVFGCNTAGIKPYDFQNIASNQTNDGFYSAKGYYAGTSVISSFTLTTSSTFDLGTLYIYGSA